MEKVNFIFLFLALIAEIVGTVGGFGSSVFFVPTANFYFNFETVLGLTAVFHVFSNISKIALFRKGLNKKLILYLGIPAVIFVIIGGLFAKFVVTTYLEIALGIFLVLLSGFFLLNNNVKIKDGKPQAVIGGTLSGLLAGLLGTGGAVRGLTMAAFNLEKSAFIATSAVIDFGVDFSRTVIYYLNGFIKTEVLIYIPFLLVIGWVGTWIGKKVLVFIPQDKFRRFSLLLIFIVGVITIIKVYNQY
jgi:uncharacterized membrane protein YfcA